MYLNAFVCEDIIIGFYGQKTKLTTNEWSDVIDLIICKIFLDLMLILIYLMI